MKKARVSIVKQADYNSTEIHEGLKQSFSYLGGLENLIRPKSHVFVKINHISPPSPPEKAIVTHPVFTKEVLLFLKQLDVTITVGDDIQSKEEDGFLISGYRKICDELGVRLLNLKEAGFREVECKGELLEKVFISPPVLEADFILNLPKLKTHSFTIFTGAVKNMFGVIPDIEKNRFHPKIGEALVDIIKTVGGIDLAVIDATYAYYGKFQSGKQYERVRTNLLIVGTDALSVDAVGATLAGNNPVDSPTLSKAARLGLGHIDIKNIVILGESLESVKLNLPEP